MGLDDFSRANCIIICCAARSSTAQPCDRSLNNFIRLDLGAVLRASVRRHRCVRRGCLSPGWAAWAFMLLHFGRMITSDHITIGAVDPGAEQTAGYGPGIGRT